MHSVEKVVVTGANGLLGYHVNAALYSINAQLAFQGHKPAFEIITVSHAEFEDAAVLKKKITSADFVIHLAGINRASQEVVEFGNQKIAEKLVDAMSGANSTAHVLYANSTKSLEDSPYGNGKRKSAEIISSWCESAGALFTNLILPHIFGEGGKPFYNTVTATLCHQIINDEKPTINSGATVELVHAGVVADSMIDAFRCGTSKDQRIAGLEISVESLYEKIEKFHNEFNNGLFPHFHSDFDVQLFNTYRAASFPNTYPRILEMNSDDRGVLFETVKGGGGGQSFISWTKPGVVRGNHYHRYKVERFVVLSGDAEIRVRKLFSNTVHSFIVNGSKPVAIDMPTLHTHNIVNMGSEPLLTMFWAHEVFKPLMPDTYSEPVD